MTLWKDTGIKLLMNKWYKNLNRLFRRTITNLKVRKSRKVKKSLKRRKTNWKNNWILRITSILVLLMMINDPIIYVKVEITLIILWLSVLTSISQFKTFMNGKINQSGNKAVVCHNRIIPWFTNVLNHLVLTNGFINRKNQKLLTLMLRFDIQVIIE